MSTRQLVAADRPLLRRATLANMNWVGPRFTLEDLDRSQELSLYFRDFPSGQDFGLVTETDGVAQAVAWLVFLPADSPGYGFVDARVPELSVTTFEGSRDRGLATDLLNRLIASATARELPGISLSVEDGNGARRLYERLGFQVVGRNGGSDTMLLKLDFDALPPGQTALT